MSAQTAANGSSARVSAISATVRPTVVASACAMITVSSAVVGPQLPGVSCRRSVSGSAHRDLSSSTPPSDASDGSSVTRNVELAVYGY